MNTKRICYCILVLYLVLICTNRYLVSAWEATTAMERSLCPTGGSGRLRGHRLSSHRRGWQPGASRTRGHGQSWRRPSQQLKWFRFYLCLLFSLFLLAATRLGDTRAASLVLWLCQMFCSEDSSGGLLPSRLLWLLSTPCSHQRREATNDAGVPPAQSVISFRDILSFLFNKCFHHRCASLVILTLGNHNHYLKRFNWFICYSKWTQV